MIDITLLLFGIWIATGLGRTLLSRAAVLHVSAMERLPYTAAVGLGVAAYLTFLIGTMGQLSFWPITLMWLAMVVAGWRGVVDNNKDAILLFKTTTSSVRNFRDAGRSALPFVLGGCTVIVLAACALLACFKPPAGAEWDAISYHLADPKQFLAAHRIYSLPTEHHSNFPLLVEMLYTSCLLYRGFALANLTHLAMTALTALALFAACRRLMGSGCAWLATVLFISTPVVFWESTVAYIEMGLALYSTLAVLAAVRVYRSNANAESARNWLVLCAVCIGFALGVKYLALVPFGLLLIYIALRSRSLRHVLVYTCVAGAIASPWYIKNAVVLHNPVYPYYYGLFHGSVNWTASRAAGYQSEQSRFGTPHSFKKPAQTASDMLLSPWDLVTLPLANPGTYSNGGEFSYLTLIGGLYFAFCGVFVLRRSVEGETLDILVLGLLQAAAWFFVAQVSRYLVSILPLLALPGACAISGLLGDTCRRKAASKSFAFEPIATFAIVLVGLQALELLWVLTSAPLQSNITILPDIAKIISTENGSDRYLTRWLETYPATEWINAHSGSHDGVLLYDETRGFYLNRPYMWANEEHSAFIPYSRFIDGRDLTYWMLRNGYRYAIINMRWAPQNSGGKRDPAVPDGPIGNEQTAFQTWYADAPLLPVGSSGYRWRGLVGDAVRRGLWTDVGAAEHGVMVLHIGSNEEPGDGASRRQEGQLR